jgi:hypothetical protein
VANPASAGRRRDKRPDEWGFSAKSATITHADSGSMEAWQDVDPGELSWMLPNPLVAQRFWRIRKAHAVVTDYIDVVVTTVPSTIRGTAIFRR